jgi:hypothetical protein
MVVAEFPVIAHADTSMHKESESANARVPRFSGISWLGISWPGIFWNEPVDPIIVISPFYILLRFLFC